MSEQSGGNTEHGDVFDFLTADSDEGKEFAEALREDTETVEVNHGE